MRVFAFASVAILLAADLGAQGLNDVRALFGTPEVVSEDVDFMSPANVALLRDGSFAVVDFRTPSLFKLSIDGKVQWKAGRKGIGPGEFQLPARVVALADQSFLVFDIGNRRVSRYSSTGTHIADYRPDMEVDIGNVVTSATGDVVIAGFTRDPRGAKAALHVFTPTMQYVRSFGLLPDGLDERARRTAGPGGLTIGLEGTLVHTRTYPYELFRYDASGKLMTRATVNARVDAPDTYNRTASQGTRGSVTTNPAAIRARTVHQVAANRFLAGTASETRTSFHLIDANGTVLSTMTVPREWGNVIGIDAANRWVWAYGERDDVPVLLRTPLLVR